MYMLCFRLHELPANPVGVKAAFRLCFSSSSRLPAPRVWPALGVSFVGNVSQMPLSTGTAGDEQPLRSVSKGAGASRRQLARPELKSNHGGPA